MIRALLLLLTTCSALAAQVVTIQNHAPTTFAGWVRRNVDVKPAHASGELDDARFVLGRRAGLDTWHCDVHVTLKPGQRVALDLAKAEPTAREFPSVPADLAGYFGGPILLAGEPMQFVDAELDGAAFVAHLRRRTGRMFCTDLWVRWYPDQPAIAYGEAITTCSNPAVPDMGDTAEGLVLKFGDAWVILPGRGIGAPLAEGAFADGQARVVPIVFVWRRHLQQADVGTVTAATGMAVGAVGIRQLWATGNPTFPPGFDAQDWTTRHFAEALRRLHTWEPPAGGLGPNLRSSDTGAQEDQLYHPGGEALRFPGAELVRLLTAWKLHGERPVNLLEADGSPLDLARHPELLMWDARAHAHRGVSPDQLGKPRALTEGEARGRWGPDTQHWLTRTLGSAVRITGSPAAHWLLERLAVAYLGGRTSVPGWSTSATFSAREWGYEGLFVVQCWRDLEDRELAQRVVDRWRERVQRILLPAMGEERDYVFAFDSDPRLGPGLWVIAWQESLAAWGIDLACEQVGPAAGRDVALRVARRMLADGWEQVNGEWRTRAQFPLAGDLPVPDGSFNGFGMPLCVATVLRHDPEDERARGIWTQLRAAGEYRWMPPGVGR